jgi:hopanoid biosynthesis associated protein HpnK
VRRLIVNADDFGLSASANCAVIRAHREGILTTASLMVNEPGFTEAVELARQNPMLGVGLHLTLLQGHAALPPAEIPGLVNGLGEFSNSPLGVGLAYFFRPALREQLRAEIRAQLDKFRATGLKLDHVNGHLHLHLHPTVFKILMAESSQAHITHMRLTRDCLNRSRRMASGRWFYRFSHAAIFELLSGHARKILAEKQIRHTQITFGLLQDSQVDEAYILKLLPELPEGNSELYAHPSMDRFRHEFEALTSQRVKDEIRELGIQLVRYQDL